MSKLSGSSEAASRLSTKLYESMKQLQQEIGEQNRQLRKLSDSCKDESFETAEYILMQVAKEVMPLLTQIGEVRKSLEKYIQLVESAENRYAGTVSQILVPAAQNSGSMKSGETWSVEDDSMLFDTPDVLGKSLNITQGQAGPQGTCGLCSVQNVCIMAGVKLTEADVVGLARFKNLCSASGGTTPDSREMLLKHLGIESHQETQSIDNIAAAVMSGKGVILSVDANKLYNRGFSFYPALHAVTVTSVRLDHNGNVIGIVICDSNAGYKNETGAKEYTVEELKKALTKRPMNVTGRIR